MNKEEKSLAECSRQTQADPPGGFKPVVGVYKWEEQYFAFWKGGRSLRFLGVQMIDVEKILSAQEWVCCFCSGYKPDLGLTKRTFALFNSKVSLMLG